MGRDDGLPDGQIAGALGGPIAGLRASRSFPPVASDEAGADRSASRAVTRRRTGQGALPGLATSWPSASRSLAPGRVRLPVFSLGGLRPRSSLKATAKAA